MTAATIIIKFVVKKELGIQYLVFTSKKQKKVKVKVKQALWESLHIPNH